MKRALLVCVLALMLVLPSLAAASGHITWVRTYDPASGEFPEGIAIDNQGNIFVSLAPIGQIRKISPDGLYVASTEKGLIAHVPVLPDGAPGALSVVAQEPELFMIDGIALDVLRHHQPGLPGRA